MLKTSLSRLLVLSLCLLNIEFVYSQKQRVFNQFFMNPFIFNPAYAGTEGHTVFYFLFQDKWSGFGNESPQISHFSFNTPLKGGIGIGAFVLNESQGGLISESLAKVAGSYLVTFDQKHFLRFGLSLGGGHTGVDPDAAISLDERVLSSEVAPYSFSIAEFGMTYHWGHFNFGLALPSLIGHDAFPDNTFSPVRVKPTDNIMFKVNYRGHLGDALAIEPHVIYRYSRFGTSQLQISAILHIMHAVWLGIDNTQDLGLTAMAGFKVSDKIGIGGAYYVGGNPKSAPLGNTMEISVGVHIGRKKKHAKHVSSFIKSHRKTLEERRAEAEEKRLAKLEEIENNAKVAMVPEVIEKKDSVEKATSSPTQNVTTETVSEVKEKAETKEERPVIQTKQVLPDKTEEKGSEKVVEAKESTPREDTPPPKAKNIADKSLTLDNRTDEEVSKSETPLKVKKGGNLLELQEGAHVIAGSFDVFEHAEDLSDKLFDRGFHDVRVGYVSARGHYYTVLTSSQSVKKAVQDRNRFRNMKGLEKIWVLIVE